MLKKNLEAKWLMVAWIAGIAAVLQVTIMAVAYETIIGFYRPEIVCDLLEGFAYTVQFALLVGTCFGFAHWAARVLKERR